MMFYLGKIDITVTSLNKLKFILCYHRPKEARVKIKKINSRDLIRKC